MGRSQEPSKAQNAATLEASKRSTAKTAAATLVTDMATAVAANDFVLARKKAVLLEVAYGQLAANRLP